MLHTHQLGCKCRTALRFSQQSLGLSSFHSASAFHSHDARRALRLACMKASLTPTCAGQTQAWSDWRSVSLLLQSSTAPEARPHQFHMLHLCQQMMDPRSHLVNRTFLKNYTLTTSIVAERSSTLKYRINTFGHFQIAQNVFSYNFFGLRCKFVFYFQRFHCLQGLIVLFFLSSQNHQFPDIRTQPKPPHKHKINVSIHGCCVMGCNPFRAYLSHSKL